MKILRDSDGIIEVELPSGQVTTIDSTDRWIIEAFPVWLATGGKSIMHVTVQRWVKTEYSSLRERVLLHRLIALGKDINGRCKNAVD
jgi:hypothetical protein